MFKGVAMSGTKITLALLSVLSSGFAQQKQPDLTGTLTFKVDSPSGRVENLIVTIGDGGTGPYKAVLAGDSSLPTHAIYRPRDLRRFGPKLQLPIVAFGNGGCRNGSGEFRNFLSDIASHGYIVVAIGPAGEALVGGSEGRLNQTQASQLLDGVDWIAKENARPGSEYYQRIAASKVALMGQSCGTRQAAEVSGDARVTTTVLMNGGGPMSATAAAVQRPASANTPPAGAPGAYGNAGPNATQNLASGLTRLVKRYAPYGPPDPPLALPGANAAPAPYTFHGPVAFINGGPDDIAYNGALAGFEAVQNVPALLAYQKVGHYPATYREPNGGAFAVAANAWLDWHLRGNQAASKMFVGPKCGLCADPKWKIQMKNTK
jgi:hypothetical protein